MYFDHNAGCRVRPEVATRLGDWLREPVANPSSLHEAGRRARRGIEEARESVANLVGAEPDEVVFTSGGTEANNLALGSILTPGAHLVSTEIEHSSILECARGLERSGGALTLVQPDSTGRIQVSSCTNAVLPGTRMVSVGWANGEIGVVQPIAAIVRGLREVQSGILIHSDAVQAVGTLEVNFPESGLDLLSLSGHKLGAPAGIGALVIRRGTELTPSMLGGPQERERRGGTENVSGIIGFGLAASLARKERAEHAARVARLKDIVWGVLAAGIEGVRRLDLPDGLPGTLAVVLPGLRGDALVAALDLRGVAVSTGSACAAGAPEPSHVLRAIGCDESSARSGLRLSFGPELTEANASEGASAVVDVVRSAHARRARRVASGVEDAA